MAVKLDRTVYARGAQGSLRVAPGRQIYVLATNGPLDRAVNLGTETLVEGFANEALTASLGTGPFTSNSDGQFDVWFPAGNYDLYSPTDSTNPLTRWQPLGSGIPAEVAEKAAKAANLSDLTSVATARTNLGLTAALPILTKHYAIPTGGDDLGAINTALADAAARNDDYLELRAITGSFSGPIVLPRVGLSYPSIVGAGRNATVLQASSDFGAGQYLVRGDRAGGVSGQACHRNLTLAGPGVGSVMGASACAMAGIELDSRNDLENVKIGGFKDGVVIRGDHNDLRFCQISGYNAIRFHEALTGGDTNLYACDLTGCNMANIAVSSTGLLAEIQMRGGHLGFSPYAVYLEAGASRAGNAFIPGTTLRFYAVTWEGFGNGAIYDEDATGTLDKIIIRDCYPFTNNPAYKIAARSLTALFRYGIGANWVLDNNHFLDAAFATMFNTNGAQKNIEFAGSFLSHFAAFLAAGKPIWANPGVGLPENVRVSGDREGHFRFASTAWSKGRLVEARQFSTGVHNTATGLLAGAAAEDVATNNIGLLMSCAAGSSVVTNNATAANERIVIDSVDPSKAGAISGPGNAAQPVIGLGPDGGAAAGLVSTAELMLR